MGGRLKEEIREMPREGLKILLMPLRLSRVGDRGLLLSLSSFKLTNILYTPFYKTDFVTYIQREILKRVMSITIWVRVFSLQ